MSKHKGLDRRRLLTALLPAAAALAIPGLALASCAPKRFPWPGVTELPRPLPMAEPRPWTTSEMDAFAAQHVRVKQHTPLLDAILDTGQAMDEQDIPAEGRELYLSVRQMKQLNDELGWGEGCYYQLLPKGEPCGMLDRFKVFWRDDSWGDKSFGVRPGSSRAIG